MATESNIMHGNACSLPNGYNKEQALSRIDDRRKTARHPRWSRQETLVLIQGKKVVESRIREGHRGTSAFGSDKNEPKWDSVSSYCKQHGVNRGPVQCRKRWSNLLVDFRKIKTWESHIKEGVESFWIMRNDLKKEMKLPGFFDKEVYEVLDGGVFAVPAIPLTLVTTNTDDKKGYEIMALAEEDEEEEAEAEAAFDSSLHLPAEHGFFSNFEVSDHKQIDQSPGKETIEREGLTKTAATQLRFHISEKQHQPFCTEYPQHQQEDIAKDRYPGSSPCRGSTSQKRGKRRRLSLHVREDTNMGGRLIKVLERNSSMLNAQLEAHSINCQLDREQRKEDSQSLIAAVHKLTDAIQRIADKL